MASDEFYGTCSDTVYESENDIEDFTENVFDICICIVSISTCEVVKTEVKSIYECKDTLSITF